MSTERSERIRALKESVAFRTFGDEALCVIADGLEIRILKRNQPIYEPGDEGRAIYMIMEGIVSSSLVSPRGTKFGLARMEYPTVFGHLATLDGKRRDAFAYAATKVTLYEVPREVVQNAIRLDPNGTQGLFEALGMLVRRAGALLERMQFLDARTRLVHRLLELTETSDSKLLNRNRRISQSELASLVGVSRQTVNELLSELASDGCIELLSDGLRVIGVDRLMELAESHTVVG